MTDKEHGSRLAGLAREHLGLVTSCGVVVLVAVRIAAVSNWNLQTSAAVLQYGGGTNVLLGATLQAVPNLIAYGAALGVAWLIWSCLVSRRKPTVREVLLGLNAVLVLVLVATLYTLAISVFLWLVAGLLGRGDRGRDRATAEGENRRVAYSLIGGVLALAFLWGSTPWLPVEQVVTKDEDDFSGYIIGTAGDETVVLRSEPRQVLFLTASDLESHRLCDSGGVGARTLPQLLGGPRPDYPDCP